jgi:dynein light intermediate chain 2
MAARRRREAPPESEVDDIWTLASSAATGDDPGSSEAKADDVVEAGSSKTGVSLVRQHETYTLFVGQKQAGKSTLITAFHNPTKEDVPKPTVALEYLFARRSTAANQPKDVAHIWELGGGLRLSALVSVPITPRTVGKAVVAVVVDLSQPQNLVYSISQWLQILRQRADECLAELRTNDPAAADAVLQAASARFPDDHPDRSAVRPLPIATLIVANKLDVFRDQDQVQKKTTFQMLRFVAHHHGAALLTVGAKDKMSQNNLRTQLTSLLFSSSSGKSSKKEVGPEKPIVVPAGSDSFEDIFKAGVPSARNFSAAKGDFIDPRTGGATAEALPTWGRVMEDFFGEAAPGEEDTPATSPQDGMDVVGVTSHAPFTYIYTLYLMLTLMLMLMLMYAWAIRSFCYRARKRKNAI